MLSRKFQLAKESQDWFTLSPKGEVILFSLRLLPLLKGQDYTFLFFRSQNYCMASPIVLSLPHVSHVCYVVSVLRDHVRRG